MILTSFSEALIQGRLLIEGGCYNYFGIKLGIFATISLYKTLKISTKWQFFAKCGSYLRAALNRSNKSLDAALIQGRLLFEGGWLLITILRYYISLNLG